MLVILANRPRGLPAVLLNLAALVVGCQALALVALAVLGLRDAPAQARGQEIGIAALFVVLAAGLLLAAWIVRTGNAAARSPIVAAQIIALLMAWTARGDSALVALGLGASAVVTLGCLLAPPVHRALWRREPV